MNGSPGDRCMRRATPRTSQVAAPTDSTTECCGAASDSPARESNPTGVKGASSPRPAAAACIDPAQPTCAAAGPRASQRLLVVLVIVLVLEAFIVVGIDIAAAPAVLVIVVVVVSVTRTDLARPIRCRLRRRKRDDGIVAGHVRIGRRAPGLPGSRGGVRCGLPRRQGVEPGVGRGFLRAHLGWRSVHVACAESASGIAILRRDPIPFDRH